jgi:HTH-type transcriptional regulator / antitoxin HigA
MKPKVIKTEADYDEATGRLEVLMDIEEPDHDELDEMELLAVLIERYEKEVFPIGMPTPIEAIRFRMDQQGLKQSDLVPYFGSKGKVSEVLSGKRPLSLQMIRKLHEGLEIPAEVLLQEEGAVLPPDSGTDWRRFPIAQMLKRGWFDGFSGSLSEAKQHAEELVRKFAHPIQPEFLTPVYYRQNASDDADVDGYAVAIWRVKILNSALHDKIGEYFHGFIDEKFAREMVQLSYLDKGPLLAKEFLNKYGIHLLIEPHFAQTYLDGAIMFGPEGRPIIGLTLRYDRLDNFWFTLCHELAHLALHFTDDSSDHAIFDNLDSPIETDAEKEADAWASRILLDETQWNEAGLSSASPPRAISAWAKQHRISAAIPAGRIRKETGNYKLFSRLVGQGKVRKLFSDSAW